MKVKFCLNSGANIHSCNEVELDTVEDLGMAEDEWEGLSDDDKYKQVRDYFGSEGYPEFFWEESE